MSLFRDDPISDGCGCFVLVACLCGAAIIIAATVRAIIWLF